MTCTLCKFEFCWLCMRKYEYYHYYVFNVKGCPGMRFGKYFFKSSANPTRNSIWKNPFFKCLWCFLTVLLGFFALVFLACMWFVLGATYEFIKCYQDDKARKNFFDDDDESGVRYDQENHSNIYSGNQSNVSGEKAPKTSGQICLIYTGLVILGLFAQPFYLFFKFIEMLMECYRRYGCWFYYFGNY
jgi:hypothetical protein